MDPIAISWDTLAKLRYFVYLCKLIVGSACLFAPTVRALSVIERLVEPSDRNEAASEIHLDVHPDDRRHRIGRRFLNEQKFSSTHRLNGKFGEV